MNLYKDLRNILMICKQYDIVEPRITVNMSLEDFNKKYVKYFYGEEFTTFCGYKITKLENSFIIG